MNKIVGGAALGFATSIFLMGMIGNPIKDGSTNEMQALALFLIAAAIAFK